RICHPRVARRKGQSACRVAAPSDLAPVFTFVRSNAARDPTGHVMQEMQDDSPPAGPTRSERVRRRLIMAVDAVLLIVVLVLLYQRALPQASAALGLGGSNDPAPAFTLATLDG